MKQGRRRARAVGSGAGFAYFHGQGPTSQLYGSTIHRSRRPGAGSRSPTTTAPTPAHPGADGGPRPPRCARDLLLVGQWAEREPGLVRELRAAGHALGNHTCTHPTMPLLLLGAGARRAGALPGGGRGRRDGFDSRRAALMRPPYGRRRPATLRAMRAEGYVPVLWSVTCWDWRKRTTRPQGRAPLPRERARATSSSSTTAAHSSPPPIARARSPRPRTRSGAAREPRATGSSPSPSWSANDVMRPLGSSSPTSGTTSSSSTTAVAVPGPRRASCSRSASSA